LEFVALPLCPPALDRSRGPAEVRAPVPCPAAPLRPGYVHMVPFAAVRCNSREVPMLPITTVASASYRLFGNTPILDHVSIRRLAATAAPKPYLPAVNIAR